MEDIKKKLEEMEIKLNSISESFNTQIKNMHSDLTQTFTHNFDKMVNVKKEEQEEPKEKVEEKKLEDF